MGVTPYPNDATSSNAASSGQLGELSAKYESNGNPGTIARTQGDLGGASYGTYQLTTNSGHAQSFADAYGGALKGLKAGSTAFDTAWKSEASKNGAKFQQAQHDYIHKNHFLPAVNSIKQATGFDAMKYPKAVQDAVWSIGVHHGAAGAARIFKNAGITDGIAAKNVLTKAYNERMKVDIYFKSSPQNIKNSVLNRFKNELSDALRMLV